MTANDRSEAHAGTRAQYQHNRRSSSSKSGAPLATLSATTAGDLELVTGLLSIMDFITIHTVLGALDVATPGHETTPEEVERRLRQLTARGYLLMQVHREGSTFIEYRWIDSSPKRKATS